MVVTQAAHSLTLLVRTCLELLFDILRTPDELVLREVWLPSPEISRFHYAIHPGSLKDMDVPNRLALGAYTY